MPRLKPGAEHLVQLAFCVRASDADRIKSAAAERGEPVSVYKRQHLQELESQTRAPCDDCNEIAKDAADLEAQLDADRFYRAAQLKTLEEHARSIALLASQMDDAESALTGCYHLAISLSSRIRGAAEN